MTCVSRRYWFGLCTWCLKLVTYEHQSRLHSNPITVCSLDFVSVWFPWYFSSNFDSICCTGILLVFLILALVDLPVVVRHGHFAVYPGAELQEYKFQSVAVRRWQTECHSIVSQGQYLLRTNTQSEENKRETRKRIRIRKRDSQQEETKDSKQNKSWWLSYLLKGSLCFQQQVSSINRDTHERRKSDCPTDRSRPPGILVIFIFQVLEVDDLCRRDHLQDRFRKERERKRERETKTRYTQIKQCNKSMCDVQSLDIMQYRDLGKRSRPGIKKMEWRKTRWRKTDATEKLQSC